MFDCSRIAIHRLETFQEDRNIYRLTGSKQRKEKMRDKTIKLHLHVYLSGSSDTHVHIS